MKNPVSNILQEFGTFRLERHFSRMRLKNVEKLQGESETNKKNKS